MNGIHEEWRPVVGLEGQYEVSNFGNVASLNYGRTGRRQIMKQTSDRGGYKYIQLGSGKKFKIHQLVAKAFIQNPENKPTVNHKDEVKTNNFVDNLEWATFSEQNKYSKGMKINISKGGEVIEFPSLREASETLNINRKNLSKLFKSGVNIII